jgi:uncharacterized radical SAM superfamily Fe-S cluster-containing enzyme
MDRFNFCVGGVKRSCIHFVTPHGQIVPTFGPRMVCTRSGIIRADARPNWRDQSARETLAHYAAQ